MLSVIYAECHKLALFAGYRYVECRYAECRGASETTYQRLDTAL